MRLREAAEPTFTRAMATPTTATQPGFAQPHSSPRPAFSNACRLLASTHGAAQPPRRLQPQLARAPAGHHSPIERGSFRPLNHRPPPLEPPSPRPRVRAGSAMPTDALRSPSTAGQPCISAPEAPRKSGIRRKSPPPNPSTCARHTKQVRQQPFIIARCAGMLGAPPHRSEPAQRPCSRRNRKPFRVGGRVRPAGGRGGDNAVERTLNRRRSRRGRRSHHPWPQQQQPRQVSHLQSPGGGGASPARRQGAVPRG